MFDRSEINLGAIPLGITQTILVKYIGDEQFTPAGLSTSCGCTIGEYDSATRTIKFSFTPTKLGIKNVTITYKGEYIITITGNVE